MREIRATDRVEAAERARARAKLSKALAEVRAHEDSQENERERVAADERSRAKLIDAVARLSTPHQRGSGRGSAKRGTGGATPAPEVEDAQEQALDTEVEREEELEEEEEEVQRVDAETARLRRAHPSWGKERLWHAVADTLLARAKAMARARARARQVRARNEQNEHEASSRGRSPRASRCSPCRTPFPREARAKGPQDRRSSVFRTAA